MREFCWLLAGIVAPAAAPVTRDPFEDRSAGSGLEVVLHNAATPVRHQIETIVGGVAALDYDGDGLLDLFFTNGAGQPGLLKPDAGVVEPPLPQSRQRRLRGRHGEGRGARRGLQYRRGHCRLR